MIMTVLPFLVDVFFQRINLLRNFDICKYFACMYVCAFLVFTGVRRGASDLLKLELQIVVNYHVGIGN